MTEKFRSKQTNFENRNRQKRKVQKSHSGKFLDIDSKNSFSVENFDYLQAINKMPEFWTAIFALNCVFNVFGLTKIKLLRSMKDSLFLTFFIRKS